MPRKAAYLTFEDNPDQEFDHFLALKLHMTVAELRERMSAEEWGRWHIYFARLAQQRELQEARAK